MLNKRDLRASRFQAAIDALPAQQRCKCHGRCNDWKVAGDIAKRFGIGVPLCTAERSPATAMDSAASLDLSIDTATKAKVERALAKVQAKRALAAEAEALVAELMPGIMAAVAADGAEEEQAAFSESEAEDDSEGNTIGAVVGGQLEASKRYWQDVRRRQTTNAATARTGRYPANKAPVAADTLTRANAKSAKGYSIFDSAKQLVKKVARREGVNN
jgi:hypothetical protein